jgi:hypothetical protein
MCRPAGPWRRFWAGSLREALNSGMVPSPALGLLARRRASASDSSSNLRNLCKLCLNFFLLCLHECYFTLLILVYYLSCVGKRKILLFFLALFLELGFFFNCVCREGRKCYFWLRIRILCSVCVVSFAVVALFKRRMGIRSRVRVNTE